MSFENYKNKSELIALNAKPETDFKLTTVKEKLGDNIYRVILQIEVTARIGKSEQLFEATLEYAGEFQVKGGQEEIIDEALLVHGVTLLFPFARQIIAVACINGGYPPVMLDPIDFKSAYSSYKNKQTKAA